MKVRQFHTSSGHVFVADMTEEFADFNDITVLNTSYCIPTLDSTTHQPEIHAHSVVCGPIKNLVRGFHKLRITLGVWTFEKEVEVT